MANLNQIVISIVGNATSYIGTLKSVVSGTQSASNQINTAMKSVAKGTDEVGKSIGKLKEGGNILSGMATKMLLFTGSFYAVAGLRNLIGGAIEEFRNLDEQLRNIQSITLESDASIMQLAKSLEGMVLSGNSAGQSAAGLAEAMYEVVSSGYSGAEAIGLVEIAAKGASAGLTDTKSTADALMTILQSYKLPVTEAANVMDHLFTIVDLGRIHFDQLNTGMGYVIPTAAALKVPIEEVGAAIELLTRQGQMPSRVMTNLNDVMTRFLKPNKEFAAAITYMGFASGAAMIKQLGLVESIRRVSELAEAGGPPMAENTKGIEKNAEATRQASQANDDMKESIRRHTVSLKEANEALAKLRPGAKGYAEAQEKVKRAQYDLNKAQREGEDAQRKLSKAVRDGKADQLAQNMAVKDSDDLLAQWMGDVRAIRALLPLAANGGRDFNDMLKAHNREIAIGGRMEKALAQQKKSFNFQVRALTSNLKALGAIIVGPVVGAMTRLLRMVNDFIGRIVIWNDTTKTATFIWEKYPDMLKKVEAGLYGVAAAITVRLIPSFLTLAQSLGKFALMILGATGPVGWFLLAVALIVGGVVYYLKMTGKLEGVLDKLKEKAKDAFDTIKDFVSSIPDLLTNTIGKLLGGGFDVNFLGELKAELEGLFGFLAGDKVSDDWKGTALGKFAIGAKKAFFSIKDTIVNAFKVVKETVTKLFGLFKLGFGGGDIGGNFSTLEKKFFEFGKIARQVADWLIDKFLPGFERFVKAFSRQFIDNVVYAFDTFKAMFDDLMNSPSFQAFVAWVQKMIDEQGPELIRIIGEAATAIYDFFNSETGAEILKWALRIGMIVAAIIALPAVILGAIAAFAALWATFNVIDRVVELWHKLVEIWDNLPPHLQQVIGLFAQEFYDKFIAPILRGIDAIKTIIPAILPIALAVGKAIGEIFMEAFNWAKWIAGAVSWLVTNLATVFAPLLPAISLIGDTMLQAFILAFKLKEAVEGIISALANPATYIGIISKVAAVGIAIADAIIDGFKRGLKGLGNIKIKIPKATFHGVTLFPGIELGFDLLGFAKGVKDFMGGLAMVGEKGPELAFLPPGTSIASHEKTSQIMSRMAGGGGGGGGRGVALNYAPQITALDADQVVDLLKANADKVGAQMRLRQMRSGAALSGRL